ncbi:MAG: TRAP transporter small permease [Hyphomicrobiales bacterium]|nr:TRAP transporter small permease [Hyphomicrobiales bacterium]
MNPLDWLEKTVKALAGLCLVVVFALVVAQVGSRFLLNFSLAAASELSIYAMIWSVFLGGAVAFRNQQHIAMDFIKNSLPHRAVKAADLIIFSCLVLILGLLVIKGYDLSQRAMFQKSAAAGLPVGYVVMAIPVGSLLALVFLIENLVVRLRRGSGND